MSLKNLTVSISIIGRISCFFLFFMLAFSNSGLGQCSMSCDDEIQLSLNQKCEAKVTYNMILKDPDNPYVCSPNGPSAYKVVVMDEEGIEIPTSPVITCEYIGRTLQVKVKHWYSGNSCWSTIVVEDKIAPKLDCPPLNLWCNQSPNPTSEGGDAELPTMIDACADVCQALTLNYEDTDTILYTCEDAEFQEGIAAKIERTWTACDNENNCHSKVQDIFIRVPALSDIELPADLVGEDALACGTCDPADLTCTGSPRLHHIEVNNALCHIHISFQDTTNEACEGTYTIERLWTIQNTCTGTTLQNTQLIEVVDNTPPMIVCANGNTAVVAQTDPTPFSCIASIRIPAADVSDDCSTDENIYVTTKVYKLVDGNKELVDSRENTNGDYSLDLSFGTYKIYYEATDDCGNVTNNREAPCEIIIEDDVAPTPVCNALTKLSLDNDGKGLIFAESFDNGSYDNCCLNRFEVRRMDNENGEFKEYVEFECADTQSDEPLLVILRVHDCNGNYADCMVEVLIDDKAPPVIIECTDRLSYSCTAGLSIEQIRDSILIAPVAEDHCVGGVTYNAILKHDFRNNCGEGAVIFEWQIFDAAGNGPAICEQLISFEDHTPFNIIFPGNFFSNVCKGLDELNPDKTGRPIIEGQDCETFEVLYSDSRIEGDSSCTSFTRTWTVTNVCPRTGEEATFQGVQMIHIEDIDDPVIECNGEFFDICLDENACTRSLEVPGVTVTDCSPNIKVRAEWSFSPHEACGGQAQTGSVEDALNGFTTPEFGPGQLWINFYATDACGNEAVCNRDYTIKDCTAPEVNCISGLTLNYDDSARVEVWANDFHQEIIDNCSECGDNYIFSFSQDTSDQARFYTCEDAGVKTAQIWITDIFGNQDFCAITFVLKGNGICSDTTNVDTSGVIDPVIMRAINGNIYKEDGNAVEEVEVMAENHKKEMMDMDMTNQAGKYDFEFESSSRVVLHPYKNDDVLNGVTTFDILQLRRHILGHANLNTPYKLIAADINHSNSITTADIVALRKVILQLETEFPNNTSWRFIKADHQFINPNNPFEGEMPEQAEISELTEDMQIDFVAVKVGDLSGNAKGSNLVNTAATSRSQTKSHLYLTQKALDKGQIETLDFTIDPKIKGLQLTLNFDPSVLEIVELPDNPLLNATNFGTKYLQRGMLTMSWENPRQQKEAFNFKIKVKSNKTNSARDLFKITSQITTAEAYDEKGQVHGLSLVIAENKYDYKLFQNQPNPFNQYTAIRFTLPAKSQGKLTIYDVTGQILQSFDQIFEKGINELLIHELNQKGVMYYQLETDFGTKIHKMIRVE